MYNQPSPIIVTVDYIDEIDFKNTIHSNFLVYAETLRDALSTVEDYVGEDNIVSVTLTYAAGSGSLFEVPNSVAKILLRGEANYTAGLTDTKNTPQNSQE